MSKVKTKKDKIKIYLTPGYNCYSKTINISVQHYYIGRQVIRRLRMSNEAVYDRQCAHEVMRMT